MGALPACLLTAHLSLLTVTSYARPAQTVPTRHVLVSLRCSLSYTVPQKSASLQTLAVSTASLTVFDPGKTAAIALEIHAFAAIIPLAESALHDWKCC